MRRVGRAWLVCVCAAMVLGIASAPAQAAPSDPLFVFRASENTKPGGDFSGPCGLAVDSSGNFYVSDYYHHAIDLYSSSHAYLHQIAGAGPLDGPCGLAVDSTGKLYANDYHREVVRYTPSLFPVNSLTTYGAAVTVDSANPTGVAVNTATGNVYVDGRTQVSVYDSSGTAVQVVGAPSLGDGYGIAVSQSPATLGRLYVPDAATDTVKVYDPSLDLLNPVAVLSGPPGGFGSLRDSAVAVDRVTGEVYVADRQSSVYSERPESVIQVFGPTGIYEGHLKYRVIDAAPVGLAVDNSFGASQGRVYVTSGNTSPASVYAYPPGAVTSASPLPAPSAIASAPESAAAKAATRAAGASTAASGSAPAPATTSEVTQTGNLRLDVNGQISPQRLPRKGAAPIAVEVGWKIATTDGAPVPKLKTLAIEINRAGRFDLEGLPTCPYAKIQPATTSRALANCRPALVGRGSFSALISLAGQESYVAAGQMLVFNGLEGKKPVLFGQIYSAKPFANSFVIPFRLKQIAKGRYGTSLTATLPASLRAWGSLTEIQMKLSRKFGYEGKQRSFISAGCPAPKGFPEAQFPLARTSFGFVNGQDESLTLTRSCKARG